MDFDSNAMSTQEIAMNITIAALDGWLKNVPADRAGEDLGREIGAMYREVYSAVDEMTSGDGFDEEDEDEEEEDDEGADERD